MRRKICPGEEWTIGQLAERAGCAVGTVRHYERIGLLDAPRRSDSGYRLYGEADLRRLAFIRRSRELGFSQDRIREMLALLARPGSHCAEMGDAILRHLHAVRARLDELRGLEAVLSAAVAECTTEAGTPACRLIEILYGDGVPDGQSDRRKR